MVMFHQISTVLKLPGEKIFGDKPALPYKISGIKHRHYDVSQQFIDRNRVVTSTGKVRTPTAQRKLMKSSKYKFVKYTWRDTSADEFRWNVHCRSLAMLQILQT
jgi:hypothetical protein